MKKTLAIASMFVVLAAVTGCRKDNPEPQTIVNNTTVTGVQMTTHYYTVTPDKWVSDNDLDYLYAAYPV